MKPALAPGLSRLIARGFLGSPGSGSPRTGLRSWGGDLDSQTWESTNLIPPIPDDPIRSPPPPAALLLNAGHRRPNVPEVPRQIAVVLHLRQVELPHLFIVFEARHPQRCR